MTRSPQVSALLRHLIFGHSSTCLFLKGLHKPKAVIEKIQSEAKKIQEASLNSSNVLLHFKLIVVFILSFSKRMAFQN